MDLCEDSYFSIGFEHVVVNQKIPYDLYINSSSIEDREKFIRIFPKGETATANDVENFRQKYKQLYVLETQRSEYLRSLCKSSGRTVDQKAAVLKDSAIHHLQNLFVPNKELSSEVLVEAIAGCRDVVDNMVDVIGSYDIDLLQDLIGKLSFHDFYTYDHSINVSMYCILLYRFLKPDASRNEIIEAGLGGLLHDLGKIKIPTQIINKSGKLTDEEFSEIKKHPGYGKDFLTTGDVKMPTDIDGRILTRIVHEHHENFDGTGYPARIAGESIHLLARVTAIADFFDAITTKRSYHKPLSTNDALALMGRSKGTKLDPRLFDLFSKHTQHFVANRLSPVELPPDFDPCQPHEFLAIRAASTPVKVIEQEQKKDFGGIKVVGDKKDLQDWAAKGGNIKIIDTAGSSKPRKKAG